MITDISQYGHHNGSVCFKNIFKPSKKIVINFESKIFSYLKDIVPNIHLKLKYNSYSCTEKRNDPKTIGLMPIYELQGFVLIIEIIILSRNRDERGFLM